MPFPTPLPWAGSERINVLVLGVDHRDWSSEVDIPRSDAMLLLTIDPARKTAGILSIPRDLYVQVPGMGEYKINTAYRWGELYDLPGGGPGTAMRTVNKLMGVPLDYYILFDFNAFVKFIDHLGGLDMHIREEIVVDPIGPGNTVKLEPGVQALSGAVVLAYARNRHTAFDDFDRSNRQQEVILAVREQILTFNMLPELILKAPQLAGDLSSGIETNLSLDQLIRLAWLARQVPEENIQRSVFDLHKDFIYDTIETAEGKQDILRIKPGRIDALRKEMFGP
jgi:LCP family protein required for cell wall assembly